MNLTLGDDSQLWLAEDWNLEPYPLSYDSINLRKAIISYIPVSRVNLIRRADSL